MRFADKAGEGIDDRRRARGRLYLKDFRSRRLGIWLSGCDARDPGAESGGSGDKRGTGGLASGNCVARGLFGVLIIDLGKGRIRQRRRQADQWGQLSRRNLRRAGCGKEKMQEKSKKEDRLRASKWRQARDSLASLFHDSMSLPKKWPSLPRNGPELRVWKCDRRSFA